MRRKACLFSLAWEEYNVVQKAVVGDARLIHGFRVAGNG
jgi:hypothetical protein